MKIVVFGADGFIGVNLIKALLKKSNVKVIAIDRQFLNLSKIKASNLFLLKMDFTNCDNFDDVLDAGDIVFHLVSNSIPGSNSFNLKEDFLLNAFPTITLLNSCVKKKIRKIVFLSSGGAIYGKNNQLCSEDDLLQPISPYGLQKAVLEKIIYLYNYQFSLSYNIIRLSNPYGPFQKPNRGQGVINTFLFNAIKEEGIKIYGNGNIVRDYIFISDAISMILKISFSTHDGIFNVGSGVGVSLNTIINELEKFLNKRIFKDYVSGRVNDIPINVLSINKYINYFGSVKFVTLNDGFKLTLKYFKKEKML